MLCLRKWISRVSFLTSSLLLVLSFPLWLPTSYLSTPLLPVHLSSHPPLDSLEHGLSLAVAEPDFEMWAEVFSVDLQHGDVSAAIHLQKHTYARFLLDQRFNTTASSSESKAVCIIKGCKSVFSDLTFFEKWSTVTLKAYSLIILAS